MRTRRVLFVSVAALAVLGSGSASAATVKPPVVRSVSPLKLAVGEKLTVRGKHFTPGKGKTRVFFVRRGGGTAFARAESASKTKLVVVVPAQMDKVLKGKPARVRIRVLTKKFGNFTAARRSPVVTPSDGSGAPGPDTGLPNTAGGDCDKDGAPNSQEADDDNDLLSDEDEVKLATDPCKADTDNDLIEDGYEWHSALDLNRTVLFGTRPPTPYPGKRPYPNPLFADAATDFDGDGLDLVDEQALWLRFGGHATPLNYSDGNQATVPTVAPDPAQNPLLEQLDTASWASHYGDGMLDDGERDADGDGLSNWDESHGRMLQAWWTAAYKKEPKETEYPLTYAGVNMLDNDSDGDGLVDGADDEDHDGLSNQFEVARPWNWFSTYISVGPNPASAHDGTNAYARVQPYNPCKPVYSESCHRHPPFDYYPPEEDWQGPNPADAGEPGIVPGPIFP
jgi:hypothetical protein